MFHIGRRLCFVLCQRGVRSMEEKGGRGQQYLPFCVVADYANIDEAAQIKLFGTEVGHCRAGKCVEVVAIEILRGF